MMYNFLSSKLNHDMAIMIFDQVRTSMLNDIDSLWKQCNILRAKIRQKEYVAIQPLRHDNNFDRISTMFGLSSTLEIEQAKSHAHNLQLLFKENLKHIYDADMIVVNDGYLKLVDAIKTVMYIMDENHEMFLDIVNSHKDRNQ